ncbi:Gfo/Idh/MocA family protein [Winogradskyella aurantiaca]|uniref:Gfo/Idh/MocA family protein n=1 Tax=Winogradskyella aurantiaca TaxID=2219558 RepID=UPI000E1E11D8|nr:Gfo/Idh/MocA family oxidoreductase [Winogradskyella aurantiaca]
MRVQWGILGTGKIASKFASEFQFIANSKIHSVASRSLEKAKSFARDHNIDTYFGCYQELLKEPEIDAIYIATPHSLHCENTLAALKNDKSVLCEKPLAMNLKEVNLMTNKAKEKELLLMEGLWTAFLPHFQFVLRHIKTGQLGKLQSLTADFGFPITENPHSRLYKKSLGGGSLLDIGIYPVFLALSCMGKPESIDARADFFENGVDKSCEITFKYNDGREAILSSTFAKHTPTEAILKFEKGDLKINSRFHEPTSLELITYPKQQSIKFPARGIGYSYEIEHFNELIRNKETQSPIMSYQMSSELMSILDRIRAKIGLVY